MQEPPFVVKVPSDRYFLDDHCANCLCPLPEAVEGLFCSIWCKEIAGAVRYQRGVFRDGRIDDPLVKQAIIFKNAFLLEGGYQALGRTLSPSIRTDVKTRDGGTCQMCGKAGTDIDHIDGSSPSLDNLQLLCADCHNAKTAENLEPAGLKQKVLLFALQLTRVMPEIPTLLADDQVEWKRVWLALRTARKQRLLSDLTARGVPTKGLKTRIDMITARDIWVPPASHPDNDLDDHPLVDWSWKSVQERP